MQQLIDQVFIAAFDNPELRLREDQARLDLPPGRLAFTTDSYVVNPLFFPGGDIGCIAVNGTVNDLAVGGAHPLYLSCGVIIEEGLPLDTLQRVAASMRSAADQAGVKLVTGDTKVVERGGADKLFINTSGVGVIPPGVDLGARRVEPGDRLLLSGCVGDHGAAILSARGELALEGDIRSDGAPLGGLMQALLKAAPDCHTARDITRGGLAAALNEIAAMARRRILIEESALPLREEVAAFCEILGLDPLHLANEGALVAFVPERQAQAALAAVRATPAGTRAAIIGRVEQGDARVEIRTGFGALRVVELPSGEQLPRIC